MTNLDKELEKICIAEGHCCCGYGCEDWPMSGKGDDRDNLKIKAIAQIKATILEAIEKEKQTNPYLTAKARVCYDRGVADCLEVVKEVLK